MNQKINKKDITEDLDNPAVDEPSEDEELTFLDRLMKELRREGLFVNQKEFVEQTLNTVESAWQNPVKNDVNIIKINKHQHRYIKGYRNPFFESDHIPYLYSKDELGNYIWNESLNDYEKVYDITSFNEMGWDWYFYQFLKLSYEWTKQHHLPCFTLKTSPNFMLWHDDLFSSMYWPDIFAHLYITMSHITWFDKEEGRFKNLLDEPIAILIGKERIKSNLDQFETYPEVVDEAGSMLSGLDINTAGINDFFWFKNGRELRLKTTNVVDPNNAKVLGCPVKVKSHIVSNPKAFFKAFKIDENGEVDADARETVQTRWFWEDLDFLLRGWKDGEVITALEDLREWRKKMTPSQCKKSEPRRFYFFMLKSRKLDYLNGDQNDSTSESGSDDEDNDNPDQPIYNEDIPFVDNDNDGLDDNDGFADNPLNDDDDNMISPEKVLHKPDKDNPPGSGLGSTHHGGLGATLKK